MAEAEVASTQETDTTFKTLQDPRKTSTSDLSTTGSTSSQTHDVKDEVAVLSDKLISAINHQQTLDDTLAETRHELELARAQAAQLQVRAQEFEQRLSKGELVTKEDVQKINQKLNTELEDERKEKSQVQLDKQAMESELETLTANLFEQANKMVATANRARDATEKKNQQLRDQIKDGEAVIASQTEQLTELKILMQGLGDNSKDSTDSPRVPSGPSSPAIGKEDTNITRLLEAMNLTPISPDQGEVAPSPSLQLVHLVRPQCRTDVPAFDDFKNLLQVSSVRSHTPSHAPSRAGSGSYGGLSGLGLGSLTTHGNSSNTNLASTQQQPATSKLASSPALPGAFSPSVPDSKGPVPLKETRLFKRIMFEDVEPTLRLDLSPTISWLNRRSILAAVADSTLIVEPIPESSQKLYGKYTACSICGESRKEGQNPRTHAMRVKEGEGANKWSICRLCLEKVRAVGDFVGYIRMVREGVVKVVDRKDEEEVWEEIIKFRERLFWARLAGGVVPAFLPSNKNTPILSRLPNEEAEDGPSPSKDVQAGVSSAPRRQERMPAGDEDADRSETESEREAQLQLQAGLDESLTTFDNAKEHAQKKATLRNSPTSPPLTPSKTRGSSGSFPKINIPRMSLPQGFWETQVNSLR